MNAEKKNSADTEPYESDRRGDYSSELEYLYHNYQLDNEVPWVRYIALYLVTAIAVACFIYIAVRYCPRRLDNPYREPEIIDKLGFFDNTSELLPELKALQEKTGAYFAIASIPGEEYRLPDDGYTIRQPQFYAFAAAAVLGILFIPWHIYRYIIKRR